MVDILQKLCEEGVKNKENKRVLRLRIKKKVDCQENIVFYPISGLVNHPWSGCVT